MNRIMLTIASVFFVGLFSTSASAQKFDQAKDVIDQAESFYKGSCGKAISGEIKNGIKNAKNAKGACSAFRNCKKTCRASKKSAKKSSEEWLSVKTNFLYLGGYFACVRLAYEVCSRLR